MKNKIISQRIPTYLLCIFSSIFILTSCSDNTDSTPTTLTIPKTTPAVADNNVDHADAIYYNGRIYTVDEDRSWAEAVAIKDGWFQAVGSDEEIMAHAGPDTKQIDLQGAMALPGLQDSHFHLFSFNNSLDCSPGYFTPEQLRETLEYCKTMRVEGFPWLFINGMVMWNSESLDNTIVDEVFPDTPVVIRDTSLHNRLVNSRVLDIAGINEDTPQPEGGEIKKEPGTGRPTGILAEGSAIALIQSHIPSYPEDVVENAFVELLQGLLDQGITSVQDAGGVTTGMYDMLYRFQQRGIKIPYINSHLVWSYYEGGLAAEEDLIPEREKYASAHVSTDAIKIFLDGIPVPPAFTHVPIGTDGEVDETNLLVPRDVLAQKLIEFDKLRLKVKMHASADGAVRVGLDAIEAARNANGNSGIWHEIGHTSDISPQDLPRFAELNAGAEVSPYFWHLDDETVGGTGYTFRSLHDNGALITIGSDYAVVESYNTFPPLQGIVEREGESVPIDVALEFVTRNAAESIGRLDDMGSIEVGKIANMIVLDRNIMEIPSDQIGETQVLKTVLDGEVVYSRK